MKAALEIRMVRENLALAIALWAGAKKGLITRIQLPTGRVVVPSDDGMVVEVFNPLQLKNDQDLARCINNQVRGAVAFSAMQTHSTLGRVCGKPPLEESDPDLRAARCAIYLLNNTLSHGTLTPVWNCPPAYRRRFEVRPISLVLDTSTLDGKPVFWQDFGGLGKYLELLEYCISLVEQLPTEPGMAEGAVAAASPTNADQLLMDLPTEDAVGEFVAARCVVGPEARAPARDLYTGYLDWCQGTGRAPLGQRSFGLRLTRMGFTRRRRGRGRHWWEGIELAEASET